MGASCTKHCLFHVPDPRRFSEKRPKARLEARLAKCDCDRVHSLRDTAFRSGFHLGLKVRKLERLLKALDAGDNSRSERAAVNEREAVQLKKDVPVVAVPLEDSLTTKIADDQLHVRGQIGPNAHSLESMIKEDFKWVLEPCDDYHPGCPTSLP